MAKLELGIGLRVVAIVLSLGAVFFAGFYSGDKISELGLKKANVEVMSNDSVAVKKITDETRELKNETDEWLKHNNPYNPDGSPTDEWLQFIQSQKSIAKQRGDQGSVIRKITHM